MDEKLLAARSILARGGLDRHVAAVLLRMLATAPTRPASPTRI